MRETGKRVWLLTFIIAAILPLMRSRLVIAQDSPPVYNLPPQLSQQTTVPIHLPNYNDPTDPTGGDILIDNFEYWDEPKNHGWTVGEPPYPVWGYGIGYGQMLTVLDFNEGSRVLDIYRPVSTFLPFNEPPLSDPQGDKFRYMPYTIIRECNIDFTQVGPHPLLSFKLRAPLAVEMFDTFRFIVDVVTTTDPAVNPCGDPCNPGATAGFARIVFIPREKSIGCDISALDSITPKSPVIDGGNCRQSPCNNPRPDIIEVYLGREFQDGTWHLVIQDLQAILDRYVSNSATPEYIAAIRQIMIRGNQYRLDDITFSRGSNLGLGCPYLFKTGPFFVQLFVPTEKLVFAEDHVGNIYDVITNPDEIARAYAKDSRDGFAPASIYGSAGDWTDPDPDNWTPADLQTAKTRVTAAGLNLNSPILANEGMRRANSPGHREDMLRFDAFVGGGAASGAYSPVMIDHLPVDLNDNRPLFLPIYYRLLDESGEWSEDCCVEGDECVPRVPHEMGPPHCSEGNHFYPLERVQLIEQALQNAGYTHWPNVAVMRFLPQYLEDLIVTVEVSNGLSKDIETFPVSVVNYPVDNYPPIMEDLDDQIAYVGEVFRYALTALDPDSYLYSATHPKPDQYTLTWKAYIAGSPDYRYGPWSETLINPHTGVISFVPQFEGVYPIVVQVTDSRGFSSINEFSVYCVNRGTWLNHPPVMLGDWDHPQVCRAGELLVLDSEIDVQDPDGDKVYLSCNIGSIGKDSEGNVFWTFQTQFPGFYVVEIFAMDARGAFTVFTIDLEVRPWWSL